MVKWTSHHLYSWASSSLPRRDFSSRTTHLGYALDWLVLKGLCSKESENSPSPLWMKPGMGFPELIRRVSDKGGLEGGQMVGKEGRKDFKKEGTSGGPYEKEFA